MIAFLNKIFAKSKTEPEKEPGFDRDQNLLSLMKSVTQSEHALGKISDQQYAEQLASTEITGLKMVERRTSALEGAVNG